MAAKKSAPVVIPQNNSAVTPPAPASPQTALADLVQRATHQPAALNAQQVLQLQRTLGNRAVSQLVGKTAAPAVPRQNRTGLPDSLKSGIESLSGIAMDDVTVHSGSDKPAQIGAAAYAQGTDIHVAPGQEKHLPHEAWHVVQQKQARVRPTLAMRNVPINDDPALESEATDMGARAMQQGTTATTPSDTLEQVQTSATPVTQGFFDEFPTPKEIDKLAKEHGLTENQRQILQWAAIQPRSFGPLAAYLQKRALIRTHLFPLTPAYSPLIILQDYDPHPTQKKRKATLGQKDQLPDKYTKPSLPPTTTTSTTPTTPSLTPGLGTLPSLSPTPVPSIPTSTVASTSRHQSMEGVLSSSSLPEPVLSFPTIQIKSIQFKDETVDGTQDLIFDIDAQLVLFRRAIAKYTLEELAELHELIQKRGAPGDSARCKEIVLRVKALKPKKEKTPAKFLKEEEEESGTDTDGSDSESEEAYSRDEPRRRAAKSRHTRAMPHLRGDLTEQRLDKLAEALEVGSDEEDTDTHPVIFKGGKRPKGKKKLYRKEPKFYEPSSSGKGKVGDRAAITDKPTKQEVQDMAQLNALLALGVSPSVASQVIPSKFVVAQYRGLFYSRRGFTHSTRAQHRDLDEVDRPIFSSSALTQGELGVSGYYYLYNDPARKDDLALYQKLLELEGQRIRLKLLAMRRQKATTAAKTGIPRDTERFKPQTMADISTHFYSEKYDKYHKMLETRQSSTSTKAHPHDPISKTLPNSSNPKVSTGDVPVHAARYAYGLKPYKGHEEETLEPEYDDNGKPRHPYSGKMYVSVHPLADYDEETGPSSLVPLQNEGRINISKMIIPERESQFEGMMESERVKAQFKAKFPNFAKPYKKVYKDLYGMDKSLFDSFSVAFAGTVPGTDERVFVEALLSNFLAKYSEFRAIDAAIAEATKQGARLVYRTGLRSFGFEPPAILNDGQTPTPPAIKQTTILEAIKLVVTKALSFQKGSGSGSKGKDDDITAPSDLRAQVAIQFAAPVITIDGSDIACYIRSLVTAAARVHHIIEEGQIENIVAAIEDHLNNVQLRTRGQMVDAGGLVAAEVRRVLNQLSGTLFDPAVHVVMWDYALGTITNFPVNTGTHAVWLFYTPGHFDLINRT